jgi:eukaryotic-like serine/threonine-protein kinase
LQEVQTTLPIGTLLRGRYVVEGLLGKGGFGAVYLVRDQRVKGNLFALKEMVDSSKQERARFAFECEVLKRVDHHSLPRVYYVFEDSKNNRAYMLMDYIEGPNLEVLRQKQPDKRFTLPQAMNIMAPIVEAISYLHSQTPPIIHRDIKPANIIVPGSGDEAILVDLGIAKEYDPESTTTAIRRCSPGYGAPEQYSRGTNTCTDIYGLGATFYTLLTGFVPDDAFYRMTQMGSKSVDPLEPVNKLVPAIPPAVSAAIQQAMSINSNDRFPTVEQFWLALNASPLSQQAPPALIAPLNPKPDAPMPVAQSASMLATNGTPQEVLPGRSERRKRGLLLPILLVLAALAVILGVAAVYLSFRGAHQATPAATPTTVVHHQKATVTPNPARTAAPTATTAPRPSPTATPTTVPPGYPQVAGTHNGTVDNTNSNQTANMTLSLNQNAGQISGNVTISGPLLGSGSIYNGSVGTNNSIQFTVTGYAGLAPLLFRGTVNTDGSMNGSYCSIDSTGNCNPSVGGQGTWHMVPNSSGSGSAFIFPSTGINTRLFLGTEHVL